MNAHTPALRSEAELTLILSKLEERLGYEFQEKDRENLLLQMESVKDELHALRFPIRVERNQEGRWVAIAPHALVGKRYNLDDMGRFTRRATAYLKTLGN